MHSLPRLSYSITELQAPNVLVESLLCARTDESRAKLLFEVPANSLVKECKFVMYNFLLAFIQLSAWKEDILMSNREPGKSEVDQCMGTRSRGTCSISRHPGHNDRRSATGNARQGTLAVRGGRM